MTSGFIHVRLHDDTVIFSKSPNLSTSGKISSSLSSSCSANSFFASINKLFTTASMANSHSTNNKNNNHADFDGSCDMIDLSIISDSNSTTGKEFRTRSDNATHTTGTTHPIISMKSYQNENDPQQLPVSVVVGLIPSSSCCCSTLTGSSNENDNERTMLEEARALNSFAYTCIRATSKANCEALWDALLSESSAAVSCRGSCSAASTSSGVIQQQKHQQKVNIPSSSTSIFSNSSPSPCGFPRSIIDRAVPLSFCFVPPPALGQEDLSFFRQRFHSPLSSAQDRLNELHSCMPWPHDTRLTEQIVDTLRICSSFVADATISDVKGLLESNYACELLPPNMKAMNDPKHPLHQAAVSGAMITPSEAAMGNYYGRGVWFTGLFSVHDGAVLCATPEFFRLNLGDQIFISTMVAARERTNSSSSGIFTNSASTMMMPVSTRYAGNSSNNKINNNNNTRTSTAAPSASSPTLPPHLSFVEAQVQLKISTSGSSIPIPGSIGIFTIDENLRFVVGLQQHQPQLSQRTTSEIFLWTSQMLENSLQLVSAREVAKFCASFNKQNQGSSLLAMCLSCCTSSSSGADDLDTSGDSSSPSGAAAVPSTGLRKLSYITPGLLRHYSSILESSIVGVMKSAVTGGRYFGVPSNELLRLNEAASMYEFSNNKNNNSDDDNVRRYYIETTPRFVFASSSSTSSSLLNSHSWREMLTFSELIMLDPNNSHQGLILGITSGTDAPSSEKKDTKNLKNDNKNHRHSFSVASFSAPTKSSSLTPMMSSTQYLKQTEKSNEAIKTVHYCLQSILHSAVKSAMTKDRPPTKEIA